MSRRTKNRVAAYFTIFLVSGFLADAAEIELKSRIFSPGSLVLLGDLANITGSDATDLEQLKRIELFPTPSKGDSRVLRRQELRELLRLNGVSLQAHTLTGAMVARISPSRRLPPKPKTKPQPAVETPPPWYVVTTRRLAKGDIIRKSDVKLAPRPAKQRPRGAYISELKQTVGLELMHPCPAGQLLDAQMLRKPILVRRNETITVVSRASGVRVQTAARATENGSLGDLIMLQALTKGREKYTARVVGTKHAEVYASGVVVTSPQRPPREFPSARLSARKLETVTP